LGTNAGIELRNRLNSLHPSIKFTLELPGTDGFVPFLDLQIAIKSGHIHNRFYQKEAKKDVFLHADSALPQSVKHNAISAELLRAKRLCSDHKDIKAAIEAVTKKVLRSGFSSAEIKICSKTKKKNKRNLNQEKPLYLPIPFISDAFNCKIQSVFHDFHLPIYIYNKGNISLRQKLSKFKVAAFKCTKRNCPISDEKMCFLFNVVYSIKCNCCQQEYIGSTSRYLHDRMQQHLFPSTNSAITEHLLTCGSADNLKISIVSKQKNIIDTRLAEAIFIYRRNPKLNRKHECDSSVAIISHYTDTFTLHSPTHTTTA
jgi:uncharacterized protein (UPF0335 family)